MDNGRGAGIEQRERLPGPYQRLLHLLTERRERLLDALVEGALASREQQEAVGEQLRASMGEVFDTFVACAGEHRELRADELALFERIGAARCSDGVPLRLVVEEFRAAFDRCYERLADLVGQPPDPDRLDALKQLTPAAYRLREAAIEAIGRGHHTRQHQMTSCTATGATGLLRALLDGDVGRLALERSRQGLAARQQAILVVAVGEATVDGGVGLAEMQQAVPGALAAQLQPTSTPHALVLATVDDERPSLESLRAALGGRSTVFTLPPGRLEQIGATYRWLGPRIQLGTWLAGEHGCIDEHVLERFRLVSAVEPSEAQRYVAAAIGPLLARPAAETARWRETLAALCETDRVSAAAGRLRRDRATVERHATHVAEITGLDAREPGPRHRLAWALAVLETHRQSLPPPGSRRWAELGLL